MNTPNQYGKEALHARIERDGSYHRAESAPDAPRAFELLRLAGKQYAHMIVDLCPEGRDLSVALAALLDDVLPMAIGAIARDDGEHLDLAMIRMWEDVTFPLRTNPPLSAPANMRVEQSFTDGMTGMDATGVPGVD